MPSSPLLRARTSTASSAPATPPTHILKGVNLVDRRATNTSRSSAPAARARARCSTCSAASIGRRTTTSTALPFDPPSRVFIDGEDTSSSTMRSLALRNEKVGFVFQFHYLLKEFTAQENVALPMFKLGKISKHEAMDRAAELLEATRPRRQGSPPRQPPQRRRAAARRHRPAPGERAGGAAGRRAHRQPRPQEQRARRRASSTSSPQQGQAIVMVTHDRIAGRPRPGDDPMEDGNIVSDSAQS